jgi:hypothetical protein
MTLGIIIIQLHFPIQIEMAEGEMESRADVVEVEYIIDSSEGHRVTSLKDSDEEMIQHEGNNKIILKQRDNIAAVAEEEVISEEMVVEEGEGKREQMMDEETMSDEINIRTHSQFHKPFVEYDNETEKNSTRELDVVDKEDLARKMKKCFLCHEEVGNKGSSWKDLFDQQSKTIMLPQLLNRYMNISIVPKVSIDLKY